MPHKVSHVEGAKTAGGHTCLPRLGEGGVDAFNHEVGGYSSVTVSQRYVHLTLGSVSELSIDLLLRAHQTIEVICVIALQLHS